MARSLCIKLPGVLHYLTPSGNAMKKIAVLPGIYYTAVSRVVRKVGQEI